jgi:hypothetical protein
LLAIKLKDELPADAAATTDSTIGQKLSFKKEIKIFKTIPMANEALKENGYLKNRIYSFAKNGLQFVYEENSIHGWQSGKSDRVGGRGVLVTDLPLFLFSKVFRYKRVKWRWTMQIDIQRK